MYIIQMCVCMCTQLRSTLSDPKDYTPPGSWVHGISQARILEQVAISFFRGSSQPNFMCQLYRSKIT